MRCDSRAERFLETKPKATVFSEATLVGQHVLRGDKPYPVVLSPSADSVDIAAWASRHRATVENALSTHGAILFRGFSVTSVGRFERLAAAVSPRLIEYRERSSPRVQVSKCIYTSTEHPAEERIEMHSEHSYSFKWPMKIWFACLKPAERGGETPVASNRDVFAALDRAVVERFIAKKVMYVRNYADGVGLSWQTAFQTTSQLAVEDYCRCAHIDCEWLGPSRLRTSQVRDAVLQHPRTGDMVWFNHVNIYNTSTVPQHIRESLMNVFDEEDLPFNVHYGDGSPIEDGVLAEIRDAYDRHRTLVSWKAGDVLLLDNMLVAHGREPFVGDRKVLVTMTDPYESTAAASR